MKLKKILALACSLVMASSMFVATANAEVDGCTATLEFAGYEVKGTTTFAKVDVFADIPDTLVPYELVGADWETTFEDTYKGLMLQGVGFDIPNVAGLTYVASLSSKADYITLTDNKAGNKIQLSYAATGSYDTYYAGEIDKLATLYYRITGDVNAEYDLALSNAVIGLVAIDEVSGAATPYEYTFKDFAVTNATVKPEEPELDDVVINSGDKYDNGYVWNVTVNKDMEAFGVKFSTANDSIEKSVKNVEDLPKLDGGVGYEFNVGLKTANVLTQADFTADDYTATWIAE